MTGQARRVQRTYLLLTLLSTLAASFIWGINTLFLLVVSAVIQLAAVPFLVRARREDAASDRIEG